jgi:hypothetical protein
MGLNVQARGKSGGEARTWLADDAAFIVEQYEAGS